MERKLYTILVHSENLAGILSQVTAVFTRRQVNIETLNVCASILPGVHKYTITAWSDEEQIKKITKQIEKKIDVIRAFYFTDDEVFFREAAIFKLKTDSVLKNPEISRIIRKHDARFMEVNPTYCIVTIHGTTEDIHNMFDELNESECILAYTNSGRIAVSRSFKEHVSDLIARREKLRLERESQNN